MFGISLLHTTQNTPNFLCILSFKMSNFCFGRIVVHVCRFFLKVAKSFKICSNVFKSCMDPLESSFNRVSFPITNLFKRAKGVHYLMLGVGRILAWLDPHFCTWYKICTISFVSPFGNCSISDPIG